MLFKILNFLVVVIANLFNLLIVGIMLSRAHRKVRLERSFGWVVTIMALPLLGVVLLNLNNQMPWWTVVLPGILMFFCLLELLFDYVLKFPFRKNRCICL